MTVTFAGDLQVYSDEYSAIGPLRRPDMVDSTNSEEGSFGKNSTASNETLKFAHHSPQSLYDSFVPQHHQHHESTSTSASDSADSSPTTTVSVADDSSVTEMSPGSSPESPMAKIAIPLRPAGQPRPATSDEQRHTPPSGSFFDLQRPATPGKRPRNLKNLAVNTTGSLGMNRAASTPSLVAADTTTETLPPMQPVQVGSSRASSPPKSRRPSNLGLTIMTPANSKVFPPSVQLSIPPTPSFSRPNLLRHFQSSPSLPMYHQTQASDSILSAVESKPHPLQKVKTLPLSETERDEPNFDIPQSREEKPEAYPDGPICVFEPHVDLYLEPSAEQAREYNVILNVASEVRNPFLGGPAPQTTASDIVFDGGGGIKFSRNQSAQSIDSATLSPVQESSSPTTPKATPLQDAFAPHFTAPHNEPEYIHIPWEHNTDIVPDLLRLVKLIDDRVQSRKRVLVHCQCGVSRSATLVVAYCLYKEPKLTVQEAYDIVKQRSKWIGPNMNLIMQLQEFRSSLTTGVSRRSVGQRSLTPIEASISWNEWREPNRRSNGFLEPRTPKTAPLPPSVGNSKSAGGDDSGPITPGPSSAPSGLAWALDAQNGGSDGHTSQFPVSNAEVAKRSSMLVVPTHQSRNANDGARLLEKNRPRSLRLDHYTSSLTPSHGVAALPSPRSEEFAMAPLQPSLAVAPEDSFGLMSPTTTEFQHSPLDREALLGSLGMGSAFHRNEQQQPRHAPVVKPRSVHKDGLVSHIRYDSKTPETTIDPLMSPRASEFMQNPFNVVGQHDQDIGSSNTALTAEDPRSPPLKGSSPITAHIADFL